MKKIKFGLVGCGTFGEVMAKVFQRHTNVHFAAACDIDKNKIPESADKHYTDYREMLEDDSIEAVSIATPDFAHTDIILSAIDAGKHVLVEKPMATNVEECEKIVKKLESSNLKLMVNFSNRWNPPFVHIYDMIQSGELGKPLMMYFRLNDTIFVPTKMLKWASKSSAAQFLASHIVDLTRWLSSSEIKKVYSVARSEVLKNIGIDTPDYFQSIIELENGGTAVVETCWIVNENAPSVFDFKCEVVGTKGSAFADTSHHRVVEKYSGRGSELPDVLGITDIYGRIGGFAAASIEHFIDCILNDKTPMITAKDGLLSAKVVSAIHESAKLEIPIEL